MWLPRLRNGMAALLRSLRPSGPSRQRLTTPLLLHSACVLVNADNGVHMFDLRPSQG